MPKTAGTSKQEPIKTMQEKMAFYLDLLTKTESRAESLRKNLFEMIERENRVKSQIKNLEYSLRPEMIRNAAALSGSLRPEQIRAERAKLLQEELSNLRSLLGQVTSNRTRIENALTGADQLVDKVRRRFEYYVSQTLDKDLEDIR